MNRLRIASSIRICLQLLPLLYWCFYPFEWRYLPGAVVAYFILGRVGADLGFHRFFSHRAFQASPFLRRFLLILGTLSARGSLLAWAEVHAQHHKHADTDLDPHPAAKSSYFRLWFADIKPHRSSLGEARRLAADPWVVFIHRHYGEILVGFAMALGLISLPALIYYYCIPLAYLSLATFLTSTVCHSRGYRNFETPDQSTNHLGVQLITLGGGLHNNHHAHPEIPTQQVRWYEFDPVFQVQRVLVALDRLIFKPASQ